MACSLVKHRGNLTDFTIINILCEGRLQLGFIVWYNAKRVVS